MDKTNASQLENYERIERELRAMVPDALAVASGRDERGVVTVTLRGSDCDVEFVENWARQIPAEELTAAISEALTAAEIARFDRRSITTEVARKDPVEAREPMFDARIAPDFLAATAELDDDAFSRSLDALVESARRAVRERLRASGPSGIATVVLGPDHRVNQVVIDADAVVGKGAADIRQDIAQAIADARRDVDAPLHIDGVEGARG